MRPVLFAKGSRMRRFRILARPLFAAMALAGLMCAPALSDPEADKAAIAARLQAWAEAVNARDAVKACDLYAPDLVASVRGSSERGREAVCGAIGSTLADRTRTVRYAPEIEEILVSGDLAVARLTWTLTLARGPKPAVQKEPSLAVFRRDADGRWSVIRFMTYNSAPD